LPPDADGAGRVVAKPSQSETTAQPSETTVQADRGSPQSAGDAGARNDPGTDNAVAGDGRQAAAAEGHDLQAANTGKGSWHLGGGQEFHEWRIADAPVGRPAQHNLELDASHGGGPIPPARQQGTANFSVSQTELKPLPVDLPDGSLLQRFVAGREQAAFTALVQRYEQFVLGVCRRVLGDAHAAQDASQVTFLLLARKASALDPQGSITGWLYKVAYHVALRLRSVAARQRHSELQATKVTPSQGAGERSTDIDRQEILQALSEELQRLPAKYQAPLVLCYLDGRTHDEAARAIGLPRGSMAKRIGESLERLRERLLQRGVTP
jgi:RNA polymerase sigma factor (sigma-70 family)